MLHNEPRRGNYAEHSATIQQWMSVVGMRVRVSVRVMVRVRERERKGEKEREGEREKAVCTICTLAEISENASAIAYKPTLRRGS